jgi:hypothetical protein
MFLSGTGVLSCNVLPFQTYTAETGWKNLHLRKSERERVNLLMAMTRREVARGWRSKRVLNYDGWNGMYFLGYVRVPAHKGTGAVRSAQIHTGWEGWGHCTTVVLETVETA